MGLLNVVLNNVEVKDESQSSYREDVLNMGSKIQVGGEAMPETVSNMTSNTERNEYFIARQETEMHNTDEETKMNSVFEASISGVNKPMNPHAILSHLSELDLHSICKLLAQEG